MKLNKMDRTLLWGLGIVSAAIMIPGCATIMATPPSTEDTRPAGVELVPSVPPWASPSPTASVTPVTPKTESSESASGATNTSVSKNSRKRVAVTPETSPSASRSASSADESVTYINGYSFCGASAGEAQPCIDKGGLVLYYPAGVTTLAGHDYMGWSWMDDLPVGRKVVIKSGALAGTYRVYGNGFSTNKMFPANGKGADVALQTCEGNGIGFSFLRRA